MLYVSRYIGTGACGVVDTDDGVEEVLTLEQLRTLIRKTGIEVRGVKTVQKTMSFATWSVINGIGIYQDEAYLTSFLTKTSAMLGVDITVWKNMITRIKWQKSLVNKPLFIRLSDYASECADSVLWGNKSYGEHMITLVLDDKIKLSPDSFRIKSTVQSIGVTGMGAKYDLRELSDDSIASSIYQSVGTAEAGNALHRGSMERSIIDNEPRFGQMLKRWWGKV